MRLNTRFFIKERCEHRKIIQMQNQPPKPNQNINSKPPSRGLNDNYWREEDCTWEKLHDALL